jgi:hypothetical protein
MLAKFLYVRYEVPRSVLIQGRVRRALPAATLVETYNPVIHRAEEATLFGIGAAAWTAVEKYHRLASGVATLLKVELVQERNTQPSGVVRLDRRI